MLIEGVDYKKTGDKKWKYVLLRDIEIDCYLGWATIDHEYFTHSFVDSKLTINKDYAWNGADYSFDTDTVMRASLAHDAVTQAHRLRIANDKTRKKGDQLFRRICLEDGMFPLRAAYMYAGVRIWSELHKH